MQTAEKSSLYAFYIGIVLLSYWSLGLHDDRQDHRATAGSIEDEAPEGVADGRLDGGPFSDMVVLALLECVENAFSPGSTIRQTLGAGHGSRVRLSLTSAETLPSTPTGDLIGASASTEVAR